MPAMTDTAEETTIQHLVDKHGEQRGVCAAQRPMGLRIQPLQETDVDAHPKEPKGLTSSTIVG